MNVHYRMCRRTIALSAMLVIGGGAIPGSVISATALTPTGTVGVMVTASSTRLGPVRRLTRRFAILVPFGAAIVLLIPGVLERLLFLGRPSRVDS